MACVRLAPASSLPHTPEHNPPHPHAPARARRRVAANPYAAAAALRPLRLSLALNVSPPSANARTSAAAPSYTRSAPPSPVKRTANALRHSYSASAPCAGAWGASKPASPGVSNLNCPSSPGPTCPASVFSALASGSESSASGPLPSTSSSSSFTSFSASRANFPSASTSPSYSPITPHLSISDLAFAEDAALLRAARITHVVSVLGERAQIPAHIPPTHRLHVPLADAPFAELVGALGAVVEWVRGVLLAAHACPDAGADGAQPHGRRPETPRTPQHVRILIHCAHGISRSPAVGAALLVALPLAALDAEAEAEAERIFDPEAEAEAAARDAWTDAARRTRTLSAPAALAYVRARRPAADPNWGFRAQLGEWERCRGGGGARVLAPPRIGGLRGGGGGGGDALEGEVGRRTRAKGEEGVLKYYPTLH
ncbi:protein-tyrosine phosphatase-like protein [Mycena rosella]|uniref:Protein-tyrosine phosphatase-like protein n=1 Tax=Mycena rosella TaxID=1033263 RepID=A0AAD7G6M7_MYCRO|nr:protein-tyrosine phosphatase-like protein [Mycena rosella]